MRNTARLLLLGLWFVWLGACGESSQDSADTCKGVSCSGQGQCVIGAEGAMCRCNSGYHAEGLRCLADLCLPTTCVYGDCLDPRSSQECVCEEGYAGSRCERCADGYYFYNLVCIAEGSLGACANDPCKHGACRDVAGQAVCDCHTGYAGDTCDDCAQGFHAEDGVCVPDSACNPDPCVHGTCSELRGRASCRCDDGYEGDFCDRCAQGYRADGLLCVPADPDNPCTPNPCKGEPYDGQNRTRCQVQDGEAVCLCAPGHHPDLSDSDLCVPDTECSPATTCMGNGDCTGNGLECECYAGYEGDHCERCASLYHWDGDVCVPDADNPCLEVTCEPNRSCHIVDEAALCRCDSGHDEHAGVCVPRCVVDTALCTAAGHSFDKLVSTNGHSAVVVDASVAKAVSFYEHIYKTWGINEQDKFAHTRDLLFDSYLGLRVNGVGTWMDTRPVEYAGYYNQDGIVHFVQTLGDLRVETFFYAPYRVGRPALVLLGRITNTGSSARDVDVYTLHNYHLGRTTDTAGETGVYPNAAEESISRDAASGAYIERGPGGAMIHRPIGTVDRYGAGAGGEATNPWQRLTAGQNLGNEAEVASGTDRVCGFQKSLSLAPGESGWIGVASLFDRGSNTTQMLSEAQSAFGSDAPEKVLRDAVGEWNAWRKPMPAGMSADERWVYRVSEAVLRMGQVKEATDLSYGQILAALPPGMWAISWVRDMAYAISGLVRAGHFPEARAALEFMLLADSGYYTDEVGLDYQISITRYFGNGMEETDYNADGPNIEFDGFGLFLWVLGEYVAASGDASLLDTHWPILRDKVAGSLVGLIAPNGMIAPDSSIWEVHWNGMQKQFAYTSLAAQRGLCEAARLAQQHGESGLATTWANGAQTIGQGIVNHALDGHFLVQSVEEFQNNAGYVDAASVEGFNWLLFDPAGAVATATLARFERDLRVAHGKGFFRNDDGGEYDSKEWVFIDLRIANAYRLAGDDDSADALLDWITAQAIKNYGIIAELHTPTDARYDGAIPMVGFGPGLYLLNMWLRAEPPVVAPACGNSYNDAWLR